MKKQINLFYFFILLSVSSCSPEIDCPGKGYSLQITLGNHTEYDIDVMLYPKAVFSVDLYLASDMGGVFQETHFTMKPQQNTSENDKYGLFSTSDTSASPKYLLNFKFDSIQLTIHDQNNSQILITPDTMINLSQNPFKSDSVWFSQIINSAMPDNDCPNPVETKSYQFIIESLNESTPKSPF